MALLLPVGMKFTDVAPSRAIPVMFTSFVEPGHVFGGFDTPPTIGGVTPNAQLKICSDVPHVTLAPLVLPGRQLAAPALLGKSLNATVACNIGLPAQVTPAAAMAATVEPLVKELIHAE